MLAEPAGTAGMGGMAATWKSLLRQALFWLVAPVEMEVPVESLPAMAATEATAET